MATYHWDIPGFQGVTQDEIPYGWSRIFYCRSCGETYGRVLAFDYKNQPLTFIGLGGYCLTCPAPKNQTPGLPALPPMDYPNDLEFLKNIFNLEYLYYESRKSCQPNSNPPSTSPDSIASLWGQQGLAKLIPSEPLSTWESKYSTSPLNLEQNLSMDTGPIEDCQSQLTFEFTSSNPPPHLSQNS